MTKGGCVYIITNKFNTVLYIGVSSDLPGRLWEHKNKVYPNSFSARYNLHKLIYFEYFSTIDEAISAEYIYKGWTRAKKARLIAKVNPNWEDLSHELT